MAWQAEGIGGGGAAGEESMNVLYNIYFEEQFVRGIQSYHDVQIVLGPLIYNSTS